VEPDGGPEESQRSPREEDDPGEPELDNLGSGPLTSYYENVTPVAPEWEESSDDDASSVESFMQDYQHCAASLQAALKTEQDAVLKEDQGDSSASKLVEERIEDALSSAAVHRGDGKEGASRAGAPPKDAASGKALAGHKRGGKRAAKQVFTITSSKDEDVDEMYKARVLERERPPGVTAEDWITRGHSARDLRSKGQRGSASANKQLVTKQEIAEYQKAMRERFKKLGVPGAEKEQFNQKMDPSQAVKEGVQMYYKKCEAVGGFKAFRQDDIKGGGLGPQEREKLGWFIERLEENVPDPAASTGLPNSTSSASVVKTATVTTASAVLSSASVAMRLKHRAKH